MLSGSKPQNTEAVESGKYSMQFRAASAGYTSDREMIGELVKRLGGEHALLEQLTAVLEDGVNPSMRDVNEDTEGYCYLRLFDRVEHADAARMGINPTVAEIRRFSNGRAAPFGLRQVVVVVQGSPSGRLAHVKFHGGTGGLRPVEALAALAKDCRVGGLPDGVSEDFPSDWIPAKVDVALTWSFLRPGEATRALDLLEWVGGEPPWLDKLYEPISAATSRVQWVLRADPLGPPTATIDVIDSNGKVQVVRTWSSYVAHTGYHQGFKVRGGRVYAEAKIWRAAKVLTDPTSPAPKPTPLPGHGDLLVKTFCKGGFDAGKNGQNTHVIPTVSADTPGFCYSNAFVDGADAIWSLGAYPTVGAIRSYLESLRLGRSADDDDSFKRKAWLDSGSHLRAGKNVFHVSGERGQGATAFWDHFHELLDDDVVGATQADVLRNDPMENVALAPTLSIRPKAPGTIMSVPFVAILGAGKECLFWDVSGGKKFAGLASYFESVELVSLRVKATVHRGDNDTLLTVAADTVDQPMQSDTDWIGAAHTLHVSGNVNGATNGELVLEGNHGFGVQLKGVSVGNPTPIIQAKLETAVAATAYLKIILTVRVAGTGIPVAMVLPTRAAKGGMNGTAIRRRDDEDNE